VSQGRSLLPAVQWASRLVVAGQEYPALPRGNQLRKPQQLGSEVRSYRKCPFKFQRYVSGPTDGMVPQEDPGAFQMSYLARFLRNESGVTAIEYGLIAAATGLALVAAMPPIKAGLGTVFGSVSGNLK
jgi:pilus assembly protein Flp/PilA